MKRTLDGGWAEIGIVIILLYCLFSEYLPNKLRLWWPKHDEGAGGPIKKEV